jgi:hypothetical protein
MGILKSPSFELVQEETPNTLNAISGLRVNSRTHNDEFENHYQ